MLLIDKKIEIKDIQNLLVHECKKEVENANKVFLCWCRFIAGITVRSEYYATNNWSDKLLHNWDVVTIQ